MLSKVSSLGPSRTTRQPAKEASKYFRRACDEAHSSNSRRHSSARTRSCFPKTPIVG